jgi:putative transposase
MDERIKFIGRLLQGEKMAPLCREFGISRVTGYKIFNRYKECGLFGLHDRSRAPYRQANRLPYQVERTILGIKKEHPTWGARKIRDKLIRQFPMIPTPAVSTIHAVLDRNGLVKPKKRRRYKAEGTPLLCGVPTTRVSLCSATASTATRSLSATIAPAISLPVRV